MKEENQFNAPYPLNTAVLFLVFNRLDTTKQVFESIRSAKPPRLYIGSDGPRSSKNGEVEKVQVVRNYIIENIDWECEVKTLFITKNLGCKYAVSGAITWFFENEEQGIILEDDCLPSQSFFWYCETLLEKYKNDERVCSISGNLRENTEVSLEYDLYKSKFYNMWGWASWRRQWKKYNVEFFKISDITNYKLENIFKNKDELCYWSRILNEMCKDEIDTWDYQMIFSSFINSQFSIYPKFNLVKNLGFNNEATHTKNINSPASKIELKEFNLININVRFEDLVNIDNFFVVEYSCKTIFERILIKFFPKIYYK